MSKGQWVVYVIEAENGFLYTGITTDLERRFAEHSASLKSAKFFRRSPPKTVRFSAGGFTRSTALKIESRLKKLKRSEKESLITTADARSLRKLLKSKKEPKKNDSTK